jgi:hypothetical protein
LKRNSCTAALLLIATLHCLSQSFRQPLTTIYTGLTAYSTQQGDALSYLNNQAALATVKNITAGVYGERRFLLAATSLYAAAVAVPTSNGNFGMAVHYSGFKNFNESQVGLAYARGLGKKLDVGIQFNYYSYRVPSYISSGTITVEIGTVMHLTDKLNLGLHVYNPVGGKFSKTDERLTSTVTVGAGYDVNDHFFIATEIVKEENFPVNINTGVQYHFMKQFFARVGIATATSAGYAGFGIGWNNFRLDITGNYHPQLGLSPGLFLIINFESVSKSATDETP